MTSELARQKAAQAWCTPKTEKIVMDPELALAFADILDDVWDQPWLGNATTRELLQEIEARIDGTLDYKTIEAIDGKDFKYWRRGVYVREHAIVPELNGKTDEKSPPTQKTRKGTVKTTNGADY